jgi:ribosomal-protein-alanine acetyltransferase
LIEEVWPKLAGHGATLTVVAGPDPELYAGSIPVPPGVRLLSFVADVRPLYEDANIVLVPTLVSAGTNVKVLEAMAMERAIVSTPSGVGGIPVEHRQHVWIAEGGEAFADGIRQLAYDPGLRDRMARRSREVVEQFFDWSRLGQMQRDVVRELLPERIFIRPGVLADLSAVRLIQAEALPTSRWDPGNYMEHEFYVGICEGVIAGFVVARRTAPDEREILNLATSGAFRRLGIGQRLLEKVIQSGDIGYVFLEVRESNWDARRLYERIGFEDVGRRPKYYDDPVETAVIMRVPTPPGHASFQNSSASERRT